MAEPNIADIHTQLQKQIGDLKKEVSRLSKSLSARASEALDEADDLVDDVKGRARGATKQVRAQAQAVGEAIRENPATAATVLSSAGVIGFLLGLVVGGMMSNSERRSRW